MGVNHLEQLASPRKTVSRRKVDAGRRYIPAMFKGFDIPSRLEQTALLVFAGKQKHSSPSGGRLVPIADFLEPIFRHLVSEHLASSAVPEHLVAEYLKGDKKM